MSLNRRVLLGALIAFLLASPAGFADVVEYSRGSADGSSGPITLVVRGMSVVDAFEMLARKERVSILVADGVNGTVSVSLFNVSLDRAVRSIAEAAGYVAERRRGSYVIMERADLGADSIQGSTVVRTFKVEYSDPTATGDILSKYLSRYGQITAFPERRLIVVEDMPEFVHRVGSILEQIDEEPRQILLETKILEVTLDATDKFGIDWKKLFSFDDGAGTFGVRGQTSSSTPGFFFDVVTPNVEAALNALSEKGRVRTLSTPTLLALEHEDAEVVIGDRLGYRVTTTINEVTTESVEFLESGVIMRFTASVDRGERIVLGIHPEVSTGSINDGLPEQTTAEVTTRLLIDQGQKVFIGGLIKNRTTNNRSGVPILGDLPLIGFLFSENTKINVNTETVVIVTAHLLDGPKQRIADDRSQRLELDETELDARRDRLDRVFREIIAPPPAALAPPGPIRGTVPGASAP